MSPIRTLKLKPSTVTIIFGGFFLLFYIVCFVISIYQSPGFLIPSSSLLVPGLYFYLKKGNKIFIFEDFIKVPVRRYWSNKKYVQADFKSIYRITNGIEGKLRIFRIDFIDLAGNYTSSVFIQDFLTKDENSYFLALLLEKTDLVLIRKNDYVFLYEKEGISSSC